MSKKPSVLFLCVANSARSQLAEGLARSFFAGRMQVMSAGSKPSGTVHPGSLEELKNRGIDTSDLFSKSVETIPRNFLDQLDFVVTLCAEEECPMIITQAKRVHWPMPDPAGEKDSQVQKLAFQRCAESILSHFKAWDVRF